MGSLATLEGKKWCVSTRETLPTFSTTLETSSFNGNLANRNDGSDA